MVLLALLVILVVASFSASFEQHSNDSLLLYNRVQCLDSSIRYKKRPFTGKTGKVDVSVSLAILSVDAISSARMDMSCDVYLMQQWFDKRCHWRPLPSKWTPLHSVWKSLQNYHIRLLSKHVYCLGNDTFWVIFKHCALNCKQVCFSAFSEQGSVLTLYSRPAEGSVWTHPGLNNLWQPDTYVLNAKKLSRPETVTHIYAKGIGNFDSLHQSKKMFTFCKIQKSNFCLCT